MTEKIYFPRSLILIRLKNIKNSDIMIILITIIQFNLYIYNDDYGDGNDDNSATHFFFKLHFLYQKKKQTRTPCL